MSKIVWRLVSSAILIAEHRVSKIMGTKGGEKTAMGDEYRERGIGREPEVRVSLSHASFSVLLS